MSGGSTSVSQTAIRCLEVLQVVSDHRRSGSRRGLALKDVVEKTGFNSSTAYRYLQTLEQYGLLQKDGDGLYKLGLKVVELYHAFSDSNDLRSVAYDHMLTLSKETEETVFLGILDDLEVFYLERVDSPLPIRPHTQIGGRNRLYCTGLGKAILSQRPDLISPVLDQGLEPLTSNTITDHEKLMAELQECRKRGFALDDMENEPEVRCVAAPIFDQEGHVAAALSISGPASRMLIDRLINDLGPRVRMTAQHISKMLGYIKT
jgi:DNA-binding IclR family transcriptional regulator